MIEPALEMSAMDQLQLPQIRTVFPAATTTISSSSPPSIAIQPPLPAYLRPLSSCSLLCLSSRYEQSLNECCNTRSKHGKPAGKMVSKSTRIIILLCIDTAFFLLELIVGYGVHSLALVADSFHMLNDVLSLCVGLWAVRIANKGKTKMYTYGVSKTTNKWLDSLLNLSPVATSRDAWGTGQRRLPGSIVPLHLP